MPGAIDATFTTVLAELQQHAKSSSESPRRWGWPAGAGQPLDPASATAHYAREPLVADYDSAIRSGTAASAMAAKCQGDYLGIDERALRARYASPIRLQAMARARRRGHGQDGGVFGRTVASVQDLLALGGK